MDRMITGIDKIMLALRDINVRAGTAGTPENNLRQRFNQFAQGVGANRDANVQAINRITQGGESTQRAQDGALEWLAAQNMNQGQLEQLIRAADPTSKFAGALTTTEARGGQLQVRVYSPDNTAKEYNVGTDRKVTIGRNFQTQRLSALMNVQGADAASDLRVDLSDAALVQLIQQAKQLGVQLVKQPSEAARFIVRGQAVASAAYEDELQPALRAAIERAQRAPTATSSNQNPNPTPSPAPPA